MADEARVPPGPIKPSHEQAVRRLLSRTGRDALWPSARSHWSVYRRVVDFTPTIGGRIPESSFAFAPPSVRPAVDRCAGREAVATGGDPVIDSFEAANGFLPPVDHRVGRWWVYGDEGCVVLPQRAHADAPGGENPSHFALHVAASDCTEWGFGLGFALNLAGSRCSYDASIYDGIYFWARSGEDPVEARFNVGTRQTEPFDYGGDGSCEGKGGGLSCWDQHSVALTLTANWRQFAYTWAELKQMGWGYAAIFDPKALTSVGLSAPQQPSKRREMWLDQVSFFKGQAPPSPFHEPKN
ncbi:MAG TPA: hypothetical protein VNW92_20540, partial [Polyangiaceae bacterium]|nr:hypothetical protein [Polyangiaceae bacterium]